MSEEYDYVRDFPITRYDREIAIRDPRESWEEDDQPDVMPLITTVRHRAVFVPAVPEPTSSAYPVIRFDRRHTNGRSYSYVAIGVPWYELPDARFAHRWYLSSVHAPISGATWGQLLAWLGDDLVGPIEVATGWTELR